MATNITDLAFVEGGNNIVVRMVPDSGTGTFDFSGITDIDFSHPAGVILIYPNEPGQQARVFVPYAWIQQIFQVV
jgi:hypothetical protein